MPTPKAIDKQRPVKQRTIVSDGMTFYLDEQNRLLIQSGMVDYPFPLDNQTTLALANLLRIFYDDIAQSAKPFAFVGKPGHAEANGSNWS